MKKKNLTEAEITRVTKTITKALEDNGALGHFVMIFPMPTDDEDVWDSRVLSTIPPKDAAHILQKAGAEMAGKIMVSGGSETRQ